MSAKRIFIATVCLLLGLFEFACDSARPATRLRLGHPVEVGMDAARLDRIGDVIREDIAAGKLPGATVVVGRKGTIVYSEAFGNAQLVPEPEPMTINKIFDMASVSKPVATATSVMILVEEGKIRLMDPVNLYIPEFRNYTDRDGNEEVIRIFHLLTHTSGLPPYTDAPPLREKYGAPCPEQVIQTIAALDRTCPPGTEFHYSCLGFITLAEIVHRVSGQTIDAFTRDRIFIPLGMKSSTYCPPDSWKRWIVSTEVFDGQPLRGFVHDPLAQLMDGKSGNAGLFSSAYDLAIFCQMLLNGGSYGDVRILSPLTVKAMTTVYEPLAFAGRGLGWDVRSDYSSNLGDIFPVSSFGHTGFTGTSICIDPGTQTFVILLTNRVHMPDGSVIPLRSKVANIVAASIVDPGVLSLKNRVLGILQ